MSQIVSFKWNTIIELQEYWETINPSTGRPFSASKSHPDAWGVTKGDEILKQQKEETTDAEIAELQNGAQRWKETHGTK